MKSALHQSTEVFHVFGDPTRLRLLALLHDHELSVSDLTAITELPQPRVSTHLARLREAGLVSDRRLGSSTLYRMRSGSDGDPAHRWWSVVRPQIDDPVLHRDRERCTALLRARAAKSPWPDAIAGEMERHYSPGRTWESLLRGILGLLRLGRVLDIGCGDGTLAQLLAPRSDDYVCLDRNSTLLAAAQRRLRGVESTRFALGDMHALPFADASFDTVLSFHVMTYSSSPRRAFAEASRVLCPGGRLALVTLAPHAHDDVAAEYGHVQHGFEASAIRRMLRETGMRVERCDVTSRDRRSPHFEVLTAFATRSNGTP